MTSIARRTLLALAAAAAVGLASLAPAGAAALSSEQKTKLAEVNSYFNSVKTMHGDFIQFGPNGERAEGKFYLARPGKIRFYYNPPSKVDIVADGKSVSVKDRKLATQDIWPLKETPLRFLLAERINLEADAEVASVSVEPDLVTVVLADNSTFGTGKLTLIFDAATTELKQWTVTDAQGYDTSVAIYNTSVNGPTNPKLFTIDYNANLMQRRGN
ncbi:outer-membrane lipoprotein carrier protein LolA [Stappia sp. 28M-7]|jgi:outer membrane lipoprotein-sorting protein|uniref:outer-membrane lipoprotein carrier protein LolA n=1 Tax=Stappia sp. 28M-7 TaxID=2762596 RepID=UPI000E771ACF|nr:outer-membrane lipoprotein carrier protein LolA [Stappia sp. 28M-7]MBC2861312.1 outer membrane lipoprotein carrier protein LolA [Stappia sp. 28M-7]